MTYRPPIQIAKRLMPAATREALAKVCVPMEDARPGDILGYVQSYTYYDGYSAHPVCLVAQRTEGGAVTRSLMEITDTREYDLLLGLRQLQCHGLSHSAVQSALKRLDPVNGDPAQFDVLILPDTAIVMAENFDDDIIEQRWEGDPATDQNVVDDIFRILVDLPDSAHGRMSLHRTIANALALMTAWNPIIDPDTDEEMAFSAPDVSALLSEVA